MLWQDNYTSEMTVLRNKLPVNLLEVLVSVLQKTLSFYFTLFSTVLINLTKICFLI